MIKGHQISASAVVARAVRYQDYYAASGGGITLTGGEVTQQVDFAEAILARCKAIGIHTTIETCGACSWPKLERLLQYADLVYYDLKTIDEQQHEELTGVSNRQILQNAANLTGRNVQIRLPLIPGITDTEDNVDGIFAFMRANGLPSIALLPYNPLTHAKYKWLGLSCSIKGEPQTKEYLHYLVKRAQEVQLEAIVVTR